MVSSREYWQYARECARWAAQSKDQEDQDLFINMAKAWTNIALVEGEETRSRRVASSCAPELAQLVSYPACQMTQDSFSLLSGYRLAGQTNAAAGVFYRSRRRLTKPK
jgi:hypothetical protein